MEALGPTSGTATQVRALQVMQSPGVPVLMCLPPQCTGTSLAAWLTARTQFARSLAGRPRLTSASASVRLCVPPCAPSPPLNPSPSSLSLPRSSSWLPLCVHVQGRRPGAGRRHPDLPKGRSAAAAAPCRRPARPPCSTRMYATRPACGAQPAECISRPLRNPLRFLHGAFCATQGSRTGRRHVPRLTHNACSAAAGVVDH